MDLAVLDTRTLLPRVSNKFDRKAVVSGFLTCFVFSVQHKPGMYVEELVGGRSTQPEIFLCVNEYLSAGRALLNMQSDSVTKCFDIAGEDSLKQRFLT